MSNEISPELVTRVLGNSLQNIPKNFCKFVQKHCREGEKGKKKDNFKAFCVTHKRKKMLIVLFALFFTPRTTVVKTVKRPTKSKNGK